MKSNIFKKLIEAKEKVSDLSKNEKYNEALEELEKLIETYKFNAPLYVKKGELIIISDDDGKYELDDVKLSFQQAIELDPRSIDAKLELAEYYWTIEDDSEKSKGIFLEIIEDCLYYMQHAYEGLLGCYSQNNETKLYNELREKAKVFFEINDIEMDEDV